MDYSSRHPKGFCDIPHQAQAEHQARAYPVDSAIDGLKAESAEFLTLKSRYQKVAAEMGKQKSRAEKLDEELSRIEMNQYIKWFLAGSGVLLLGFIIGFSARRQRRRSSLL